MGDNRGIEIPTRVQELLAAWETECVSDRVDLIVAAAVIRSGCCILLMQRVAEDFYSGLYELPGGAVESGETMPEAVVREVHEETGMDVVSLDDAFLGFDFVSEGGEHIRQYVFEVRVASLELTHHPEHEGFVWVSAEDYGTFPMTPGVDVVVQRALRVRG